MKLLIQVMEPLINSGVPAAQGFCEKNENHTFVFRALNNSWMNYSELNYIIRTTQIRI
jgi:hypothetical protein